MIRGGRASRPVIVGGRGLGRSHWAVRRRLGQAGAESAAAIVHGASILRWQTARISSGASVPASGAENIGVVCRHFKVQSLGLFCAGTGRLRRPSDRLEMAGGTVAADGQRTVNHTAAVPHQSEAQFHVELAAVLMHRPGCQHLVPVLGLAAVDGFVKAVPVRVSERSGMITSRLSPRTSLGA